MSDLRIGPSDWWMGPVWLCCRRSASWL